MHKNVKKLITLCALCALLATFAIPSASAGYLTSTATVNFGSDKMAYGGEKALYGVALSGTVQSSTAATSSGVNGYLYTRGAVWTHKQDEAYASNEGSATLYWANAGADNGVFWAQCQASGGDHAGNCKVTQYTTDAR